MTSTTASPLNSTCGHPSHASPITHAVRNFYQAHPYPRYPLLAKPLWREGYLCPSAFTRALAGESPFAKNNRTLIAGCGEILPFVIRSWEPRSTRVTAVDLSSSSIQRARLRCLRTGKSVEWITGSLESWLPAQRLQPKFTHADAYGVLHHLASPTRTLQDLAGALVDGGTLRLMVYNTPARHWIRHLQRAFDLLGWRADDANAVRRARSLVRDLGSRSDVLGQKLATMGPSILDNETRFCDTFLHPREARISVTQWLHTAQLAGLRLIGVHDRYGEADHLLNPLWAPPSVEPLEKLARDGTWEGNWELFFIKSPENPGSLDTSQFRSPNSSRWPKATWSLPPRAWRSWDETRAVSLPHMWSLWQIFQTRLRGSDNLPALRTRSRRVLEQLPAAAAQRLARIGAILPDTVDVELNNLLSQPISLASVQIDCVPPAAKPLLQAIEELIQRHVTLSPNTDDYTARRVRQSVFRFMASTTKTSYISKT